MRGLTTREEELVVLVMVVVEGSMGYPYGRTQQARSAESHEQQYHDTTRASPTTRAHTSATALASHTRFVCTSQPCAVAAVVAVVAVVTDSACSRATLVACRLA